MEWNLAAFAKNPETMHLRTGSGSPTQTERWMRWDLTRPTLRAVRPTPGCLGPPWNHLLNGFSPTIPSARCPPWHHRGLHPPQWLLTETCQTVLLTWDPAPRIPSHRGPDQGWASEPTEHSTCWPVTVELLFRRAFCRNDVPSLRHNLGH